MDASGNRWYFSCMAPANDIPIFTLFGETSRFPDVVHHERITDRAGQHNWVISPHRHAEMAQVFYLETGRAQVTVDGRASILGNQSCLYVPAQIVHGFTFDKGTEGGVISLPLPVVHSLEPKSPALTAALSHPFSGVTSPELQALFDQLSQGFSRPGQFRAALLVALAHAVLVSVCDTRLRATRTADPTANRHMPKLDAMISENMGRGWMPRDYASALSITTGHLNRLCKQATGQSTARYIEQAEMTEACRLLAFTQLPVAEVAYRLGIVDPAYFARRFRAVRGETPTAYRESFLTSDR